jgi:outer membrane protein TolC
MKSLHYFSFLQLFLFVSAGLGDDLSLLSEPKQSLLRYEGENIDAEHEKLRTNWLSPINLSGSYSTNKNAQGGYHNDVAGVSASVSQDIFRSGGITYQIEYADAKRQTRSIELKQTIASLNAQLFNTLLNLKKSSYQLEQSDLRLKNKEIEIFIKRQLYDAGKVDITELNNAMMEKSGELKTRSSLHSTLSQLRLELSKNSDIDPDTVILPTFSLTEKEHYLHNQFDLAYARSQNQTLSHLYDVTRSAYLPTLSVNGTIGYQDYDARELSTDYNGQYYTAGVSLTLPLSYNSSATIQEAKTAYLKENALIADKAREIEATYVQSLDLIDNYHDIISITRQNLALYDDLIKAIQAGVNAGVKTGYDLQTLNNTKLIEELEIKINEINIQLELAKLHFAISTSKELL